MSQFDELPEGWYLEEIHNLCDFGPRHSKKLSDDLEISFVPMSSVDDVTGTIQEHEVRRLGEVKKGYTHFANGDVIFAKITPCMENGKAAVAADLINGIACGSTEFHVLRSNGSVLPDYIYRYLRQQSYRDNASQAMTGAVGQRRVPKQFLLETKLPLPPLNEQRRIVEKIEALTARSRKARAALDEIPALLDQFRQSVLAAAFRGDLTADWRAQNPNVEPAEVLLERIRVERRQHWEEAEFEKMKVKGKEPKSDQWKEKYKELAPFDELDLYELPPGWAWAYVEQIVDNFDHLRVPIRQSDRASRCGQFPYYGAFGIIDYIDEYIFDGQYLLIAEDGKNLLYRNKPISFLASDKFWVNNHAHIMKTLSGIPLSYLRDYFNSIDLTFYLTGIDQVKLTRGSLDKIPIPIPPLEEQGAISSKIQSFLKFEANILGSIRSSFGQLEQLDQSILTKAFRGELVPQDPTDEPAAVLLDRIRAEREQLGSSKKRGKVKG